jgi:putative hydrolase of the HAD superfamily
MGMEKVIIFDADEVVVKREIYFNFRLEKEYGIPVAKTAPFFQNEYKLCAVGKEDLKKELEKRIKTWGWKGSVDNLLKYWLEGERETDDEMIREINSLRGKGYICCLATNNEAYRTKYLVEEVELGNLFDYIFSSSKIGHLKSEDSFWKYVWDEIGVNDKENIVVWDSDEKIVKKVTQLGMKGFLFGGAENFRGKIREIID